VSGIEKRRNFGIMREHPFVEMLRESFSMLLKDRSRGLHDIDSPLG
jgi:hypothetical protein